VRTAPDADHETSAIGEGSVTELTRQDIERAAAQALEDAHLTTDSTATSLARHLAAAGLLADPAQTTELEKLRGELANVNDVLDRVRRKLGTPDGRAVSVYAAEVRAERNLALWLHAEAAWRVAGFDAITVKLAQINKQMTAERDERQARITDALALHTEVRIFQPCGHEHDGSEAGVEYVDEVGSVCQDGYQYSICRACCCDGPDGDHGQHEVCADTHCPEEKPNLCWPCPTRRALKPARAALAGDQPTTEEPVGVPCSEDCGMHYTGPLPVPSDYDHRHNAAPSMAPCPGRFDPRVPRDVGVRDDTSEDTP